MNKAQVGKCGERVAARYLGRHGYKIVDRNVHLSHQEIDIVAINKQFIVFAEVKTRVKHPEQADYLSSPAAAVTYQKQAHLLRAASEYLRRTNYTLQPRMDVIEVYLAPENELTFFAKVIEKLSCRLGISNRRVLHINHIENAFGLHGYRA